MRSHAVVAVVSVSCVDGDADSDSNVRFEYELTSSSMTVVSGHPQWMTRMRRHPNDAYGMREPNRTERGRKERMRSEKECDWYISPVVDCLL